MAGIPALLPEERTRLDGANATLNDPVAKPPFSVGAVTVVTSGAVSLA